MSIEASLLTIDGARTRGECDGEGGG